MEGIEASVAINLNYQLSKGFLPENDPEAMAEMMAAAKETIEVAKGRR